MDASILLARLLGPLFLAAGAGLLINQEHYRQMLQRFLTDTALYYFSGTLALTAGVAILLFHNLWVADWRVLLTVIGWLSVAKGLTRLLLPKAGLRLVGKLESPAFIRGTGILSAGLGVWLCFMGYVV